jgi:hypothetical protein
MIENIKTHILEKYPNNLDIRHIIHPLDEMQLNLFEYVYESPKKLITRIFDKTNQNGHFETVILKEAFDSDEAFTIFYIKEIDLFFAIFIEDEEKVVKIVEFNIFGPDIKGYVTEIADYIIKNIKKIKLLSELEKEKFSNMEIHLCAVKSKLVDLKPQISELFTIEIPKKEILH